MCNKWGVRCCLGSPGEGSRVCCSLLDSGAPCGRVGVCGPCLRITVRKTFLLDCGRTSRPLEGSTPGCCGAQQRARLRTHDLFFIFIKVKDI